MAALRAVWRWLAGRPWLMVVLIVAGGQVQVSRAECRIGNDTRDDLRHAIADTLTDNLAAAAASPPPAAVIDRYRRGLLDDLEREFPDRNCW